MTALSLVIACVTLALCLSSVTAFRMPVSSRYVGTFSSRSQLSMEFDWKSFKKGNEERMGKSVESIQSQMNTLRAGGASTSMLDRIFVDYFGTPTALNQIARVSTSGAQQLVIEPFDKSVCKEIEKAISNSDLNLTANNDGTGIIRINVPQLTEERRKDLAKQAKVISEDGKVAVRNIRRESVDKIKAAEKDKDIGKDDSKGFQDDLQKSTDEYIKKLDTMLKTKEKDLLTL